MDSSSVQLHTKDDSAKTAAKSTLQSCYNMEMIKDNPEKNFMPQSFLETTASIQISFRISDKQTFHCLKTLPSPNNRNVNFHLFAFIKSLLASSRDSMFMSEVKCVC